MIPPIVGSLLLEVGKSLIDRVFPDPAQKAAAELELLKMQQAGEFKQLDTYVQLEAELSKRAVADMASDSWLSKNIRPLIMVYFLTLVTLMAFGLVSVKEDFVSMVRSFTEYGLMFYFGGRSLEKISSIIAGKVGK